MGRRLGAIQGLGDSEAQDQSRGGSCGTLWVRRGLEQAPTFHGGGWIGGSPQIVLGEAGCRIGPHLTWDTHGGCCLWGRASPQAPPKLAPAPSSLQRDPPRGTGPAPPPPWPLWGPRDTHLSAHSSSPKTTVQCPPTLLWGHNPGGVNPEQDPYPFAPVLGSGHWFCLHQVWGSGKLGPD